MRNILKGLDLIDRVPNELRMEVRDIVQEKGIKAILKKKKCKKAKWLSEEALQIAEKRREAKGKAKGFPGGSEVKASASNAGDRGWIPGSGRSPGEGNGNPLQYSCLENPMDGGAW